jgi:hypothetical protein
VLVVVAPEWFGPVGGSGVAAAGESSVIEVVVVVEVDLVVVLGVCGDPALHCGFWLWGLDDADMLLLVAEDAHIGQIRPEGALVFITVAIAVIHGTL